MKIIICLRDGFKCDLNTKTKTCRHMTGEMVMSPDGHPVPGILWQGKCFDRFERKGNITELVSIKKIHDAEKDDDEPQ